MGDAWLKGHACAMWCLAEESSFLRGQESACLAIEWPAAYRGCLDTVNSGRVI